MSIRVALMFQPEEDLVHRVGGRKREGCATGVSVVPHRGCDVSWKFCDFPYEVAEAPHSVCFAAVETRDYGEWGSWATCSEGNRICGLEVRLEDDHPLDDDAGLTDIITFCCN